MSVRSKIPNHEKLYVPKHKFPHTKWAQSSQLHKIIVCTLLLFFIHIHFLIFSFIFVLYNIYTLHLRPNLSYYICTKLKRNAKDSNHQQEVTPQQIGMLTPNS